jgi:hypothetical protein
MRFLTILKNPVINISKVKNWVEQITKADRHACHALCRTERSELMNHRR